MNRHNPIEYLTECTLATVEYMAGARRISKHEYKRQISIAQFGIEALRGASPGGRCGKIIARGITVEQHAAEIRNRWFPSEVKESNSATAQGAPASGAHLPRLDGCEPSTGEKP